MERNHIILSKYNAGQNSSELAKEFGIHPTTVCRVIKKMGGVIRPNYINKRVLKMREDFFSNIDSEEKAYLLGFLFADGNVHKDQNMIKIEVHQKDQDILEKFIENIYIDSRPKIGIDKETYLYICICSKIMKDDLVKLGCVPAKSLVLKFPDIPKEFIKDFLRGYFDGDGCINIYKGRVRAIITGSYSFLEEIFSILHLSGSCRLVRESIGEISFSNKNAIKFLNYIYKDSRIYLDRKYEKFKSINEYT